MWGSEWSSARHWKRKYNSRTGKSLLDYQSAHSKIVTNGVTSSCTALNKSCVHHIAESVSEQVERLDEARYPVSVVRAEAQRILKRCKQEKVRAQRTGEDEPRRKTAAMPCMHGLSQ